MKLAGLTQIALLGTERQALPKAEIGSPLGALLSQLDLTKREPALLSAAALAQAHEQAGTLPGRDAQPRPLPCPAEELGYVNARAGSLLGRLLDGEHAPMLPEWLSLAAQRKQLALPELLPALLTAGANQADLREAALPVLGKRGEWLAAHNPEWSWVAGGTADEKIWDTGDTSARVLFLRQLRRTQPTRALELLAGTWKDEPPDDRAAFLAELETGLSAGDEAFLEAALNDKRKEVRRQAAALLARLPESAFAARMTARVQPLLAFTPGETGSVLKLKQTRKPTLTVTLPAECDKAMQRDGIEPKPPHGFGEKAWWLVQILEAVPLSTWTNQWITTPAEIISASLAGEWKKELSEAWLRAALRQRNGEWADALWETAMAESSLARAAELLPLLPALQWEKRLAELLAADDSQTRDAYAALLTQSGQVWSIEFSRAVLAWMRMLTRRQSSDWQLRNQLERFAFHLAPATLSEALRGWQNDAPGWAFWAKGIEDFLTVAQFRADMHTSFAH